MKYLKAILGAALLATLLSVPTGCGGSGGIEKTKGGDVIPPPPGHAAAAKDVAKPPTDAK